MSDTQSKYVLRLYITGRSARSDSAINSLKKICSEELAGQFDLSVIDVLENPKLAENEKIMATPTLIKELPPPMRRIIGDLSDVEQVLLGLDLSSNAG